MLNFVLFLNFFLFTVAAIEVTLELLQAKSIS